METTKIWSAVSETDPQYVKPGQRGMSSIDGYYFLMFATKQFGPCGLGWGYDILDERLENALPLFNGEGELTGHTKNHVLKVRLWFKVGEETGSIENYGVTKYSYQSKNGLLVDEEAPKKSLTDAIKKCLSMLGFCSDVYMGKFEDMHYREEITNKKALEQAVDKDAEAAKQAQELTKDAEAVMIQMSSARSLNELQGLYKAIVRKINGKDKALLRKIEEIKETKKEEMEND